MGMWINSVTYEIQIQSHIHIRVYPVAVLALDILRQWFYLVVRSQGLLQAKEPNKEMRSTGSPGMLALFAMTAICE